MDSSGEGVKKGSRPGQIRPGVLVSINCETRPDDSGQPVTEGKTTSEELHLQPPEQLLIGGWSEQSEDVEVVTISVAVNQ